MLPLSGVRVIDLSRLLPGPAASWYLHGMGAEIIKIEDPAGGDYVRYVPPFDDQGLGLWFVALNGGKRSVALDLKQAAHRAALGALLTSADVLIEGFRPGVMARLGLDPVVLSARFPRLIIASLTGYGQTGPWADLPGHDLDYCAIAGALSLAARHDGVPDMPGVQVADLAGGALTTALAISAALYARERSGRGQWLDLSMAEGTLAMMSHMVTAAAVQAPAAPGTDTLTGGMPNYGLYRCADGGVVALGALEPKFWAAFCAAVGADVPQERAALDALFATRDRDAWVALAPQAAVAPVLELNELASHPQHKARGVIQGTGAATRVRVPFPGARFAGAAPALGEHTDVELRAVGFDPAQLSETI